MKIVAIRLNLTLYPLCFVLSLSCVKKVDSKDKTAQRSVATEQTNLLIDRDVPDVRIDDDRIPDPAPVLRAERPSVICGTTQSTVKARISHCLSQNPKTATWNGVINEDVGLKTWRLVTRTASAKEVWRDEQTKLLWGDLTGFHTWCRASGNAQKASEDGTGTGLCEPAKKLWIGYQLQDSPPTSVCAENSTLGPALKNENWSEGVYDDAKGGMGAVATAQSPSIKWRLPKKNDWESAYKNGLDFVLPNLMEMFWTGTVVSSDPDKVLLARRLDFYVISGRQNFEATRCIGRDSAD
jgi:hypothetical protein